MTASVQPIEGITPAMLWNFVLVLLGLCAIVVLVYKVIEIMRKEHDRKVKKQKLDGKDLTDEIADKVMEKMKPQFDRIDEKLASDKERLDSHERRLNQNDADLDRIGENTEMLLDAMDGLLMHFISGNDKEKLKNVKAELDHYKNSKVIA
jgi:hypothetical protein